MALSSFARGLIQFLFLAPSPRFLIFKFFLRFLLCRRGILFWGSRGLRSTRMILRDAGAQKNPHTKHTNRETKCKWSAAKRVSPYIWLRAHCSVTLAQSLCFHCTLCKKKKFKNEKVQFFPPATLGFSCLANLNSNRQKKQNGFLLAISFFRLPALFSSLPFHLWE